MLLPLARPIAGGYIARHHPRPRIPQPAPRIDDGRLLLLLRSIDGPFSQLEGCSRCSCALTVGLSAAAAAVPTRS
jgi:hypothetical protein